MKTIIKTIGALSLAALPSLAYADWPHDPPYWSGWQSSEHRYNTNKNHWNDNRYDKDKYHNHVYYDYDGGNRYNYGTNYQTIGDTAIRNGIRDGQLSRNEVRELREEQRKIQLEDMAFKRDGRLDWQERENLKDDVGDFNRKLHHELNDGERGW